MSQVPVKWVYPDRLLSTDDGFTADELANAGRIPVVELSALREVVEGLKKQYRGEACYIYKEAFSDLLASLGEVGK